MMVVIVKGTSVTIAMRTALAASDIKQRMIEQAVILLAKKGLQGASFSEMLQASSAPRGSLYHHFPGGKDELVLALRVWMIGGC